MSSAEAIRLAAAGSIKPRSSGKANSIDRNCLMAARTPDEEQEPGTPFLCIGEAVAEAVAGFRSGARHAVVVLLTAPSRRAAMDQAQLIASKLGWRHITLTRAEEANGDSVWLDEETLRHAINVAKRRGHCVAVDVEEVPLDS
jgi:hypothetical protein